MSESTTVRVSRDTLEMLERLRDKLGARSLDEALRGLVTRQRRMMIDEAFGLDRGRVKPFTEEDRGEGRN